MPKSAGLQVRIDVTPIVGVLLALFVVMLATTPTSTASTLIDLPPATPCMCDIYDDEPVTVSILVMGKIAVNGRPSSSDSLAADICLNRSMDDCLDTRVYLDAPVDASYGDFTQTVDDLRAQGFRKLALINRDFPQS